MKYRASTWALYFAVLGSHDFPDLPSDEAFEHYSPLLTYIASQKVPRVLQKRDGDDAVYRR